NLSDSIEGPWQQREKMTAAGDDDLLAVDHLDDTGFEHLRGEAHRASPWLGMGCVQYSVSVDQSSFSCSGWWLAESRPRLERWFGEAGRAWAEESFSAPSGQVVRPDRGFFPGPPSRT